MNFASFPELVKQISSDTPELSSCPGITMFVAGPLPVFSETTIVWAAGGARKRFSDLACHPRGLLRMLFPIRLVGQRNGGSERLLRDPGRDHILGASSSFGLMGGPFFV